MVGSGGGGMAATEFSVVYHCEFIFYGNSKKATEVNLCQL